MDIFAETAGTWYVPSETGVPRLKSKQFHGFVMNDKN